MPELIIALILLVFVIFCIAMIVSTSKANKVNKKIYQDKMTALAATDSTLMKHMAGLPVAEGMFCNIYLCADKYMFEYNQQSFNLMFDKVTDVVIKTETEIQKTYVSSVGGAVGGAVLFGPLGAMIGGRAKKKQTKTVKNFLIFSYKKEENTEFISFDCTGNFKAGVFVRAFEALSKNQTTVDL